MRYLTKIFKQNSLDKNLSIKNNINQSKNFFYFLKLKKKHTKKKPRKKF